jgi:hypothetical protein
MLALHWLRTRQEAVELSYWLSIVSYKYRDHSVSNRIYLFYLILFFSVWIFVTLTFFASGIELLLIYINPNDPIQAATFLEVLLLGSWCIFSLRQSCKRSPVSFSEQDGLLLCQTPINRSLVPLRWLLMPWIKNAVLFWLIAITLGFSVAEISMSSTHGTINLIEYAGYGIRAWLAILPIHLALFSLQWAVGIYRLQKNINRDWLIWLVMPVMIVFFSFLLISLLDINIPFLVSWNSIWKLAIVPLKAGFLTGNLFVSLLPGSCFAIAMLAILVKVSGTFSLSRAAQETGVETLINTANQYGFSHYAEIVKAQKRLGINHAASKLPSPVGAGSLLWKDILQSQRTFRLSSLFDWFFIFLLMFGFSLLPDFGSQAFLMAIWVIHVGKVSVVRLRSDLSCWSLMRQLPISHKKLIFFDLCPAYLFSVFSSIAGLAMGSILFNTSIHSLIWLIPGIVASVVGLAVFDIMRHARSNLLLSGFVPKISALGSFTTLSITAIPLLLLIFLPRLIGISGSILVSLGLGYYSFILAVRAYRTIAS